MIIIDINSITNSLFIGMEIEKPKKETEITKTTELQDLRGPSYIYAFINDDRFKFYLENCKK
ncbi:hypothetical protein C6C12_10760 [Clostridium botulinum]|uniref:hypothetical protein n=1 Tax=Clostridium botulinum TaxID=1491 RepID=UPI000D0D0809|nr:hypothetical protein [Clostridium botulinum]PSM01424.1 hypothetical protein C6C12_10760 [Clostridium botulinum]